ncbi:transducin-like enhancer protein 2, partial [Lates japonicus]
VPLQPGQSFKFTVLETLDRIKEEFQFLQAQYHSLKLECEKLASEKTEMQRHYIMCFLSCTNSLCSLCVSVCLRD